MYNQHLVSQKKKKARHCGFTLVETLVAVGLFAIVTTVASSAFLAMVSADRTSRSLRIATDNLSLSLEDMSRRMKTGTAYSCGGGNGTQDCLGSATIIAFDDQNKDRIFYKHGVGPGNSNAVGGCGNLLYAAGQGCILRKGTTTDWTPTTSHEIDIKTLKFVVGGSSPAPDTVQPYVIILVEGEVGVAPKPTTKFKMQTMVTQRQLDI